MAISLVRLRCRVALVLWLFGAGLGTVSAELQVETSYGPTVTLSVRENLRIRENGIYQGLRYREGLAVLRQLEPSRAVYRGRFLTLQETMRGTSTMARQVAASDDIVVTLPSSGGLFSPPDQSLPRIRYVPTFPSRPVSLGEEWSSPGLWIGDPGGNGAPFTVLLSVAYRYVGTDVYGGRPVHVIEAGYRLRYPVEVPDKYQELVASTGIPSTSPHVLSAFGNHRLTILVSDDGTQVLLIRDVLTDEYELNDGTVLQEEGFHLTFHRTSSTVEDSSTVAEVIAPDANATVDTVDGGLRITVMGLRFQPDSAELIPGEERRFASIARVLDSYPERSVLVVGHTADVGRTEGQRQLSVERARTVVNRLIALGIRPDRLLYEGRGGTEPIAPNDTEDGRRRNRRVEIIILDDLLSEP